MNFHLPKNSGNSGWDVNGWNTTFWFVQNVQKGSPVFGFKLPNGKFTDISSSLFLSPVPEHQFHTFRGLVTLSRWLDFFACRLINMDLDSVSVHEHAKKELQLANIQPLISHLVNNPYLFWTFCPARSITFKNSRHISRSEILSSSGRHLLHYEQQICLLSSLLWVLI